MLFERSAAGALLEWRPHCLVGALRALHIDGFELEPVLHAEAASSDRFSPFELTPEAIVWTWENCWDRVEARPLTDGRRAVVQRQPPESPRLDWAALSQSDTVEITFFGRGGSDSLTCLVERPVPPTSLRSVGGREEILVREPAPRVALVARLYRRIDQSFSPTRHELAFRPVTGGQTCAVDPGPGLGAVAVVQRWPSGDRLVAGYACVQGTVRARLDDAETEKLRQAVEGTPRSASASQPWEERWPHQSRTRLRQMLELVKSTGLTLPSRRIPAQRLTGIFRQALLVRCGCPAGTLSEEQLETLSGGELCAALGGIFSGLPRLTEVKRDDELVWLLRHAADPAATPVFETAAHRGAAALDRMLKVLPDVNEVKKLRQKVVESSAERREVDSLLAALASFPEHGNGLGQLRVRRAKLEARIAELDGQPDTGPREITGPVLVEPHRRWHEARQAMLGWRNELALVLAFCESGAWTGVPSAAPEEGELTRRLRRLEPPIAPLADGADHRHHEMVRTAEGLVARAAAEDDQVLRNLAIDRLRNVVVPAASRWPALHREIQEAERARSQFRWLDARLPAADPRATLNQRAAAAHELLRLAQEVRAKAQQWRGTLFGRDGELLAVLATPDHPAAAKARQELEEMRGEYHASLTESPLERSGDDDDELLEGAGAREVIHRWWAQLSALEVEWEGVNRRLAEQRRQAADYASAEQLRVQRVVAFWDGRAPAERPAYYERLRTAADACYAEGRGLRPLDVRELLKVLVEHPTWDDDWKGAGDGGRFDE